MEKTTHPGIAMAAWSDRSRPEAKRKRAAGVGLTTKTMSSVICRSSASARHGAGRAEARMPRSRSRAGKHRIPREVSGEMQTDTLKPGNCIAGRRQYRSNGRGGRIQRPCVLYI